MCKKYFSIRISSDMLEKLRVIAKYEGRSLNSEILILIRDYLKEREKEKNENSAPM